MHGYDDVRIVSAIRLHVNRKQSTDTSTNYMPRFSTLICKVYGI